MVSNGDRFRAGDRAASAARAAALLGTVVFVASCGGGGNATTPVSIAASPAGSGTGGTSGSSPNPVISWMFPDCVTQGELFPGDGTASVQVDGSGFAPGAVVRWNGSDRPTTYQTSGQLTAHLQIGDYSSVGTAIISVGNPAPSAGNSNGMTFTITPGGVAPNSITLDSSGQYAYVASQSQGCSDSDGTISMYAVDPTNGVLTSISPSIWAGYGARSLSVAANSGFVYVAAPGTGDDFGDVESYAINPTTHILAWIGTAGYAQDGIIPSSIALSPAGKYAYVADPTGFEGAVFVHSIDPATGTVSKSFVGVGEGDALFVAIDASGSHAYVVSHGQTPFMGGGTAKYTTPYDISTYRLDATTGAMQIVGVTASAIQPVVNSVWGDAPIGAPFALDHSGRFAYSVNSSTNSIASYAVDPALGTLSGTGEVAAGTQPVTVAIDPTNRFAYVANSGSNTLGLYRIDTASGQLAFVATVATGQQPDAIAFDRLGRFIYVTNRGSNDISMYGIDAATGVPTLLGTIGT